jgi:thiamine-monophosphate kinase
MSSEFALIDRYFKRAPRRADVRIGIGDDAAVLAPSAGSELAVSVDMLVEGRHFFAGTDPVRLGHKALAVNLSDLAAMGAAPRYALLAGALPDADEAWLAGFMRGFRALAEQHDVELVGGDTYHFEIVANESAAGVAGVQLDCGIPIGNGILTCDTDEQARARMDAKGYEATQAALELANLLSALDER